MAGVSEVTPNLSALANMLGSPFPKIDGTADGQKLSFDATIGNNLPTVSAVDTNGDGLISAEEKQAAIDKFSSGNASSLLQAQEKAQATDQSAATADVPGPFMGNVLAPFTMVS